MPSSVLRLTDVERHPFVQDVMTPHVHERSRDAAREQARKLARLADLYAGIAGDREAFTRARTIVAALTSDYEGEPERRRVREIRTRLLQGSAPEGVTEETVAWMLLTREERWARLAARLGVPPPSDFELYRGVRGRASVGYVLAHWMAAGPEDGFPVLQHALASWSLSRSAAERFMRGEADTVLYQATVPFEATFADLLVDDSSFVVPYQRQWEVVAGPIQEGEALYASLRRTQVRFQGRTYGFEQRHLCYEQWSMHEAGRTMDGGGAR